MMKIPNRTPFLLRIIMPQKNSSMRAHSEIHNKNKPAAEKTMRPIIEASIMGFSAAAVVASLLEGRMESTFFVDSGVIHIAGYKTVSHGPTKWDGGGRGRRGTPALNKTYPVDFPTL